MGGSSVSLLPLRVVGDLGTFDMGIVKSECRGKSSLRIKLLLVPRLLAALVSPTDRMLLSFLVEPPLLPPLQNNGGRSVEARFEFEITVLFFITGVSKLLIDRTCPGVSPDGGLRSGTPFGVP
jgi:hypothetical protein